MNITDFVGRPVSVLLASEPYRRWPFERSDHDDPGLPPCTYYEFEGQGLTVECDAAGVVTTAFLYSQEHGGFNLPLFEVPLSLRRHEVLDFFGTPESSRAGHDDPILGRSGPWDRFHCGQVHIHFEYLPDTDTIRLATIMLNRVVPQ